MNLKTLTDEALIEWTKEKAANERQLQDQVLAGLYEIETRKLFSDLKCTSLFDFCIRILGYSEGAAQRRIDTMRLLKSLPSPQRCEIRKKMRSGELKLNQIAQVQSFVRKQNKVNKKQQKEISPTPSCSARAPRVSTTEKIQILEVLTGKTGRETEKMLLSKMSPEAKIEKMERERIISDELTELRFAADKSLMEKLTRLKGLLAHSHPGIGWAELIELMTDKTIQTIEKKRFGASLSENGKKPEKVVDASAQCRSGGDSRKAGEARVSKEKKQHLVASKSRRVPTSVKRRVFLSSEGRCEKCGSEYALELDHRIPFAVGGESKEDNIRLLCRPCNQRAAIQFFGKSL